MKRAHCGMSNPLYSIGYATIQVEFVMGRSGCPTWEKWALDWLNGKDRSTKSARLAWITARDAHLEHVKAGTGIYVGLAVEAAFQAMGAALYLAV